MLQILVTCQRMLHLVGKVSSCGGPPYLFQNAVSTYRAIVDDLQIQDTECSTDTDDEYDLSSPESED